MNDVHIQLIRLQSLNVGHSYSGGTVVRIFLDVYQVHDVLCSFITGDILVERQHGFIRHMKHSPILAKSIRSKDRT